MIGDVIDYINAHNEQSLKQLFEILRIPSISTDPNCVQEVRRCADALAEHLKESGMEQVQIFLTARHPVVYAEWLHAPNAPTVLIYGHYDVQPVDPLDQWHSPPFAPEVRDGSIYARGASDDKGQVFAHIKALAAWLEVHKCLPINVKLVIEGEEEIGSTNFHNFLQQHTQLLQADVILISDTAMYLPNVPTICYGTRGLVGAQINLKVCSRDLHSGDFGGAVANPMPRKPS